MTFLLMGTNSGALVCIIMGMVAQADSQLGAFLTVLSPREQLRAKRLAVFVRRHRNLPAVERRRLNDSSWQRPPGEHPIDQASCLSPEPFERELTDWNAHD
jgi:hypothetical protein